MSTKKESKSIEIERFEMAGISFWKTLFSFHSHIKEHMDVPIDTSKMTEQELQFHYFTMHDSDKNNKLDGSELIKSLIHWHGMCL